MLLVGYHRGNKTKANQPSLQVRKPTKRTKYGKSKTDKTDLAELLSELTVSLNSESDGSRLRPAKNS